MANLRNFTITIGATQQVTTHTLILSGQVIDDSGNVLGDFTGVNTVSIPQALNSLTAQQAQDFGQLVANFLLRIKFPGTIG